MVKSRHGASDCCRAKQRGAEARRMGRIAAAGIGHTQRARAKEGPEERSKEGRGERGGARRKDKVMCKE